MLMSNYLDGVDGGSAIPWAWVLDYIKGRGKTRIGVLDKFKPLVNPLTLFELGQVTVSFVSKRANSMVNSCTRIRCLN